MIIYMYDLKIKDKKVYNVVKRRFYYHFNNLLKKKSTQYTKSSFLIEDTYEEEADRFFLEFQGFIKVYKIRTQTVEKLLEPTPSSRY